MRVMFGGNNDYDSEGIGIGNALGDGIDIRIQKSKLSTQNVQGFKQWLQTNPTTVVFILSSSEFIPLPHDQQVKLRTFANKTNISFLTEIEGTIKAQIPKSLGATVNTHTTQISNLNKELDRVKKLEESTVSTVTTESDFTTVEATSNGYFEDVKLEGKTLVNLATQPTNNGSINHQYATISTVTNIKPSTEYTYIIRNNGSEMVKLYLNNNGGFDWFDLDVGVNSTVIGKAKTLPTIDGDIWLSLSEAETVVQNLQVVLLEGDHTQNPPSYFEGLKSVGDTTDEIVVSSVYNKHNLIDLKTVNQDWGVSEFETNISSNNLNYHSCEAFDVSFLRNKQIYGGLFRDGVLYTGFINFACIFDEGKKQIGNRFSFGNEGYIVPSNAKYMRLMCYSGSSNTLEYINRDKYCISLIPFKDKEPYTPYQSDKKRLLYYNEETQAWEKPILREWDSIEKHSNGKYYYHQRSGEVVLNGSENWEVAIGGETEDIITYRFKPCASTSNGVIICDKFKNQIGYKDNIEGIYAHANGMLYLSIQKTKASNIEGLKVYLQANNITVVYQLEQEKVYECTNIDLITYANETNYVVESGAIVPKTTLKVHNNISNVVSLLQKKVSLLESNVKASQEVQDMMILETDMRMLDIELALMDFMPMTLNLGGSNMLRSATYFNFLKNHIINKTYEKEYLENVMNKYLATGRINQDEYNELYKMLYPPVYDIELPIEY